MHAVLEETEVRLLVVVERDDLAVEDASREPSSRPSARSSRYCDVTSRRFRLVEPHAPALAIEDRAHAVPFDLVGPAGVVARQLRELRHHRHDPVGHRLVPGIGRVHPVDHPVLALGLEEDVLARQPLAVEGDHHLVLAELVRLVGALVPDLHLPGAVLALRDLPREVDVLERVVLDVDGEVVALRVVRDSLSGSPTRRARRRARAGGPSAGCGRDARARRNGLVRPCCSATAPPGSGVASKSRFCLYLLSFFCDFCAICHACSTRQRDLHRGAFDPQPCRSSRACCGSTR